MKVLLLEDATDRITFFKEKFKLHELFVTDCSKTAIDYIDRFIFDVLFLDNDLGEGNGYGVDVSAYLQSHPENLNNHSKIIIHSWNTPESIRMSNMLPKAKRIPFNTNILLEIGLTNLY